MKYMKYTGGSRAWQFLKRNARYVVDWWMWSAGTALPRGEPFPILTQTREAEEAAGAWGLLAWEDPLVGNGPASPFWKAAPTLEAVPMPGNPVFAELFETPGVGLSGVRMSDGAMVVKVEQGAASVQLRFANADALDLESGFGLVVPGGLETRVRLRRAAELWPIGASNAKSRASGCRTGSFSWRSTCPGRAGSSARSVWPSAGRRRSRREAGRAATCARWCAGGSRRPNGWLTRATSISRRGGDRTATGAAPAHGGAGFGRSRGGRLPDSGADRPRRRAVSPLSLIHI